MYEQKVIHIAFHLILHCQLHHYMFLTNSLVRNSLKKAINSSKIKYLFWNELQKIRNSKST